MKNRYEIRGDVTAIFLTSPKYGEMETLISTNKLNIIKDFKYKLSALFSPKMNGFYCVGKTYENYRQKTFYLHRMVVNCPSEFQVDHANHITLDNTDSNLRIVTYSENQQNKNRSRRDSSTGIRGVYWDRQTNKWYGLCRVDKKDYYTKYFLEMEDAEKAVRSLRRRLMPFSVNDQIG